jgi:DNA polymerase-3 subunit delta'
VGVNLLFMADSFVLTPYPWQQSAWQQLCSQVRDQKLPHALLVTGPQGIGKHHFVKSAAQLLLCLSPINELACGSCKTCKLMAAGSHPDFITLMPEEGSKVIKIDQVRHLTDFVSKTPQQGLHKVVIIGPVESLNNNSANALLKSLEEPAGSTTLLLVSHSPSLLMATIRSRCQKIEFSIPSNTESLQWLTPLVVGHNVDYLLECANGAPLAALDLIGTDKLDYRQKFAEGLNGIAEQKVSPLDVAKELQKIEPIEHVETMLNWLQHALKYGVDGTESSHFQENELLSFIQTTPQELVFRLMDKLFIVKRQILSGANPNKQLLLEELLLDWDALSSRSEKRLSARKSLLSGLN